MGRDTAGRRAAALPWLCPAGGACLEFAEPAPAPATLAGDPGAVLLMLRFGRPSPEAATFQLDGATAGQPILADAAAKYLETNAGWLDPTRDPGRLLISAARRAAATARIAATELGGCSPDAAAAAALVAPLGWFAAAVADPDRVTEVIAAIRAGEPAAEAQRRIWGHTADDIARRLCLRWRLPVWVSAVVTNLRLPPAAAERLGAPRRLFEVVAASIAAAGRVGANLGLTNAAEVTDAVREIADGARVAVHDPATDRAGNPATNPLMPRLLRTAARARRADAASHVAALESQLDRVRAELGDVYADFDTRVRDAKLAALAELAAGAGHEINNPLAVITGNASRLAEREPDGERAKSLDSIVRHARRLSEIVGELMLFARPTPPARRPFDAAAWLDQVVSPLRAVAAAKGATVEVLPPESPAAVLADPGQIGRAIAAVVRNGIDAVEAGGWVRVGVRPVGGRVAVVVEDSGPGPDARAAEHLFDPFFSGRAAGRGRGLGLATAWRLAANNGGTLRFDDSADGPTRFVFEFPATPVRIEPAPQRVPA